MTKKASKVYRFDIGNGRNVVVEECGTGQAIIFIHGVLMSRQFFRKQKYSIGQEARFISIDMPGHGDSSDEPYGHTVAEYASVLEQFITSMNLENIILAGWSMGAFITWEYIKYFGPGAIAGMVIIDEVATDFKRHDYEFAPIDMPFLLHLMEVWQTDRAQIADLFIDAMFLSEATEDDRQWMKQEMLKTNSSNGSAIVFDQTMRDYRLHLSELDIPSLLIFGKDEKLISVKAAEDMHRRISGSELEIFEQSGHCPFLEESDRFNESIMIFARKHRKRQ